MADGLASHVAFALLVDVTTYGNVFSLLNVRLYPDALPLPILYPVLLVADAT